jgi:diaminopimelate decarboxylase
VVTRIFATIDSKFGISIHQLPLLVRIVENTKMNIVIHMHTGSDILDIEVFLYAAVLFDAAKILKI